MSESKGVEFGSMFITGDLEESGIWVDYSGGFRIRIAPLSSRLFLKEIGKAKRDIKGVIDDEASPEMMEKLIEPVSRHILKGWENLNVGGKPYPYSPENSLALLKSSADFYREVVALSSNRQRFLANKLEADAGN